MQSTGDQRLSPLFFCLAVAEARTAARIHVELMRYEKDAALCVGIKFSVSTLSYA